MTLDKYAPIGVFDSGLGGLTVVREIMKDMPNERLVYFGDTARVPYGTKSKNTIIRYSRQIINFLKTQNVKAIVVACNTASALALDTVEKEIDIPIIGVVKPGAEMALQATCNKKIGVIATDSTIRSNLYQTLITEADESVRVFAKACPLFVSLVEEGWTDDMVTEIVAQRYLYEILNKNIDTLILGCTHYPLLSKLIGKVAGKNVKLVNPAYETARALNRMLTDLDLKNDAVEQEGEKYQFFASDMTEKFSTFANSILPYDVKSTKQIRIESYQETLDD